MIAAAVLGYLVFTPVIFPVLVVALTGSSRVLATVLDIPSACAGCGVHLDAFGHAIVLVLPSVLEGHCFMGRACLSWYGPRCVFSTSLWMSIDQMTLYMCIFVLMKFDRFVVFSQMLQLCASYGLVEH